MLLCIWRLSDNKKIKNLFLYTRWCVASSCWHSLLHKLIYTNLTSKYLTILAFSATRRGGGEAQATDCHFSQTDYTVQQTVYLSIHARKSNIACQASRPVTIPCSVNSLYQPHKAILPHTHTHTHIHQAQPKAIWGQGHQRAQHDSHIFSNHQERVRL